MTSRDVGTTDFLPVSPWVVRPADLQPPLPPEPLRWLTIKGAMSIINAVDARIDRQIRARRAGRR
ncbi:MAG: hypothetical protein ABSA52_05990 [Candidatus Binatia bacterium]|jgi:hypothetical protein